jgi:PEP-CTERM motif
MKNFKPLFVAIVVIAACLFTASKPALADTYQIFNLNIDNTQFYGMDDSGTVVLSFPSCNNVGSGPCYHVYVGGVLVTTQALTPPALAYDNGTPCTPAVPPGGLVEHGVCNNGRDAFTGFLAPTLIQPYPGVYLGSYPDITTLLPPHNGEGFIFMNSQGDIVFDDDFSDNWFLALDTTTHVPEPDSILLLGTGALGILGTIRRQAKKTAKAS